MKRIFLSLIITFFISGNAYAVDKLEFDILTYKLGMTYKEIKEKGIKDGFYFTNFSAIKFELEETNTDINIYAEFCPNSKYNGKLFEIHSRIWWGKKESLEFVGKLRDIVIKMSAESENNFMVGNADWKTIKGIYIKRDLKNGETWKLSFRNHNSSLGSLSLIRTNIKVCP